MTDLTSRAVDAVFSRPIGGIGRSGHAEAEGARMTRRRCREKVVVARRTADHIVRVRDAGAA